MNSETRRYVQRVLDKQEEILALNPWRVRDALRELNSKLRAALPTKEESGAESAPTN